MDVSHLLDALNDAQRQAVAAPLAPTLVLAGAGSGKTRVLTHRVAWLVQVEHVSPHGILAVTFTNKAAGEMRGRIETMLGLPAAPLWVGTFHGIAHRLLRMHWREAGLPQAFQILDSEDQQRLVRKVVRSFELDEARWIPKEIAWFINAQKDEGLRPKHLKDEGDPTRRQMIRLYEAYEEACRRNGVVDFAELLLRSFELWREAPGLVDHYRRRFGHILVVNLVHGLHFKKMVARTKRAQLRRPPLSCRVGDACGVGSSHHAVFLANLCVVLRAIAVPHGPADTFHQQLVKLGLGEPYRALAPHA